MCLIYSHLEIILNTGITRYMYTVHTLLLKCHIVAYKNYCLHFKAESKDRIEGALFVGRKSMFIVQHTRIKQNIQ